MKRNLVIYNIKFIRLILMDGKTITFQEGVDYIDTTLIEEFGWYLMALFLEVGFIIF